MKICRFRALNSLFPLRNSEPALSKLIDCCGCCGSGWFWWLGVATAALGPPPLVRWLLLFWLAPPLWWLFLLASAGAEVTRRSKMQKTKLGGRRPTVAVIARRRRLHESEAGAVAGSGHVLSSAAMRLAERAHVPEQGRRATHSQPSPPANTKQHFH
jgi:hypothetical protein